MNKRDYSDDEARQILKRAVEHQEQDEFRYNEQQLLELGRDLGLSQEAIVKAEQELLRGKPTPKSKPDISEEEALFRRERLQPFKIHVMVFLAMMPLMFVLNLMMGLAFPFFWLVFFGWGAGLVGYYVTEGRMEGDAYEKAYDKWKRKRQKRVAQRRNE